MTYRPAHALRRTPDPIEIAGERVLFASSVGFLVLFAIAVVLI